MSELLDMMNRHYEEIKALRARCQHRERDIKISKDPSCVGMGSAYPASHVVCHNCGLKKIIFYRSFEETKVKVEKTMKRQGFKDERLDLGITYQRELE